MHAGADENGDLYIDDDDDELELADQVCHFCGNVHRPGVMLFSNEPDAAPMHACDDCVRHAFVHRNAAGQPQFVFRRNVN
jgi:hypothetical protein